MKKTLAAITISMMALAGCQSGQNKASDGFYADNGNTIDIANRNEIYNKNKAGQSMNQYGFVRHQESPTGNDQPAVPMLDREALADAISSLEVTLPAVSDAATLVTDEEILIAYDTKANTDKERFEVADQVKRTAFSIAPRYYHVYISDDHNMFQDIQRFGQMDATEIDHDKTLDQTIKTMLKSPQGRVLSQGENENGESIGELNDEINDDYNTGRPLSKKKS